MKPAHVLLMKSFSLEAGGCIFLRLDCRRRIHVHWDREKRSVLKWWNKKRNSGRNGVNERVESKLIHPDENPTQQRPKGPTSGASKICTQHPSHLSCKPKLLHTDDQILNSCYVTVHSSVQVWILTIKPDLAFIFTPSQENILKHSSHVLGWRISLTHPHTLEMNSPNSQILLYLPLFSWMHDVQLCVYQ